MFVISKVDITDDPEFILSHLKDVRGIKSSSVAKEIFKLFQTKLILNEKMPNFEWAMLCVSFSIAHTKIDTLIDDAPDTQGIEILSLATCFQVHWRFWLALVGNRLIESLKLTKNQPKHIEPALLTKFINALWHDGAIRLKARYDALLVAYPNAYDLKKRWLQEIADLATKQAGQRNQSSTGRNGQIESAKKQSLTQTTLEFNLNDLLLKVGFKDVEVKPHVLGVRYNIYTLQFANAREGDRFASSHSSLVSEMGRAMHQIRIERCTNGLPNSYFLNVLRDESAWLPLDQTAFSNCLLNIPDSMLLPVCVGTDEQGNAIYEDLIDAPHVLVGGTTGSGKSVCVKAIIQSLTYQRGSELVQLALFDPKQVEFNAYNGHNNLWNDQVYIDDIMDGLHELVEEMETRYAILKQKGVSKITELPVSERPPFIVAIVDELADLVDTHDGAQDLLIRLAQKSRASGIHLVLATQRPDAKTFDGRLRSNAPARIALKTLNAANSTIILGQAGAENLVGKGDRLVSWGKGVALRHGYYLD